MQNLPNLYFLKINTFNFSLLDRAQNPCLFICSLCPQRKIKVSSVRLQLLPVSFWPAFICPHSPLMITLGFPKKRKGRKDVFIFKLFF